MKSPTNISLLTENLRVVSIIGLEKNTGKTVVLNKLLKEFGEKGITVGLTSTGLEGERRDQIYLNEKPEISLNRGTYFATSEKDFRNRQFSATVIDLKDYRSPLGKTVFARAETDGKVILSGPSIFQYLLEAVSIMKSYGCERILIDGSTSRMSPGAPLVSDGIILATGAALSMNIEELCRKTLFAIKLISLKATEPKLANRMLTLKGGVWIENGETFEKLSSSALTTSYPRSKIAGKTIFIDGSLTSSVLLSLSERGTRVVVNDFSRIFVDERSLMKYERAGGRLEVLHPANLVAVTVNPFSPTGFKIHSRELIRALEDKIDVPVVNVLEEILK